MSTYASILARNSLNYFLKFTNRVDNYDSKVKSAKAAEGGLRGAGSLLFLDYQIDISG